MQNQTFLTILDILAQLALAATFLGAAFVSFLIFKQDKVKNWLEGSSKLLTVVLFVILTHLLYTAAAFFVNNFVYFPRRLIVGDSFDATVRCLSGLLSIAGLVVGSVILLRNNQKTKLPEEIEEEK